MQHLVQRLFFCFFTDGVFRQKVSQSDALTTGVSFIAQPFWGTSASCCSSSPGGGVRSTGVFICSQSSNCDARLLHTHTRWS